MGNVELKVWDAGTEADGESKRRRGGNVQGWRFESFHDV
jgi:hypothetical protein